jgi:hypothetical protein
MAVQTSVAARSRTANPAPGLLQQASTQLLRARAGLVEAALATSASERYVSAHLAALRAAAAVLAVRTRPASRRGAPPSVWTMLATVAPELHEWATFFAASASRRADAEAGIPGAVGAREADDLLRDAETFLALIETTLGVAHQQSLPRMHAALRAG